MAKEYCIATNSTAKTAKGWKNRSLTWDKLKEVLLSNTVGSKDGKCFVPGRLVGDRRRNDAVQEISLLVVDIDGQSEVEVRSAVENLDCHCAVYSTHSHGLPNKGECWRVVLPLEQPFARKQDESTAEFNKRWKETAKACAKSAGFEYDDACFDIAHCFYLSRHPKNPPLPPMSWEHTGKWFNHSSHEPLRDAPKQKFDLSKYEGRSRLSNEEVVRLIRQDPKMKDLFEGYWHGYSTQSEADMAFLCGLARLCACDAGQMKYIMTQSGLYRGKCNRKDYLAVTISKAINWCRHIHPAQTLGAGYGFKSVVSAESPYRSPKICAELGRKRPEPRSMLCDGPGGIPANVVCILSGQGGAGKSQIALQIGASFASSKNCTGGLYDFPKKKRRVLLVAAEDDEHEIALRLWRLRSKYGDIDLGGMHVISAGGDFSLLKRDPAQNLIPTQGFADLCALVEKMRPDLVILDPAAQIAGPAQIDSNNSDATWFIALLGRIRDLGCAVLLVHHASKASVASKSGGQTKSPRSVTDVANKLESALAASSVRGASALTDNARWVMTMTLVPASCCPALGVGQTESVVAVSVPKSNYSSIMPTTFLKRVDGLLEPFGPESVYEVSAREKSDIVLDILGDGIETRTSLTKKCAEHENLPGRDAVRSLIDEMVQRGDLLVTPGKRGGGELLTAGRQEKTDW